MTDDQKYITFKRSEFYEMMGRLALPPFYGKTSSGHQERAGAHWDCADIAARIEEVSEKTCVADAVVIRRQDVFAPPALDAYANAIQTAIAVLCNGEEPTGRTADLREIADYFHEQAVKAWEDKRKMPD
jgi:hypothetical protein